MSTVSFPVTHSNGSMENDYYTGSFHSSSASGFQMNPLSSHPPRTPRTSMISSSHNHEETAYEAVGEEQNLTSEVESDDEPPAEELAKKVRTEDVWREVILTSNGRDKAFKLLQYSLRLYLLFHTSVSASRLLRNRPRPPWDRTLVQRLESTASGLSFSRKTLLLFNWLSPLTTITAQQAVPYMSVHPSDASKANKPFLHTLLNAPPPVLLELVNAMSDDVYTLSLLGLLGKKTGERAGRFSDWCWLLATLVGLVENSVERQIITNSTRIVQSRLYKETMSNATAKTLSSGGKVDQRELTRLQREDYWLQITRAKLVMDLIFVSYDVFRLRRARKTVQTLSGLAAAILSAWKLFDRQKTVLFRKPSNF